MDRTAQRQQQQQPAATEGALTDALGEEDLKAALKAEDDDQDECLFSCNICYDVSGRTRRL